MNIVLFEDRQVEQLFPITLSRPAYAISCGGTPLSAIATAMAKRLGANLVGMVRPYMDETQDDYLLQETPKPNSKTLWLNARMVPDLAALRSIEELFRSDAPFCSKAGNQIVAAMPPADASWDPSLESSEVEPFLQRFDLPQTELGGRLLDFPHHVIADHIELMGRNLKVLCEANDYHEVRGGVFASGKAQIHEQAVLDTSNGPIVLDDGAIIGPLAVVQGPIRIGANSHVLPHTFLKGSVSVGHHCKIGGEVSKSVIEPYSNKSHFGYLGSSYVGSWVNLGAGTTNSNLKNTYGTVRVEYESGRQETGMQFLGCVIGDYTKTAIHTAIYTGKILGVCSNVYGTVTRNVPSFANYARSLGEVTEHSAEVMEATQKRVFERRGIEQLDRHKRLIRAMYEIEAPKRKLANQPPSL